MANEPVVTIIGNLVADPEVRATSNGITVATFTVASTPRFFKRETNSWEEGETLFMRCSAWRELGENIVETLAKGSRVIVQGKLTQRSWSTPDGQKRSVVEMTVDDIGPSLRYAVAQVTKTSGGSGGGNYGNRQAGSYSGGGNSYGNNNGGQGGYSNSAPSYDAPRGGGQEDPWGGNDSAFDSAPPF